MKLSIMKKILFNCNAFINVKKKQKWKKFLLDNDDKPHKKHQTINGHFSPPEKAYSSMGKSWGPGSGGEPGLAQRVSLLIKSSFSISDNI